MKHAVAAVLLSAVALHVGAQAPPRDSSPQPQTSAIRGRVVSGDSDSPVRKARVTLVAESGGSAARDPIYSDGDGRFEFADIPPGRYTVSAWKSAFALGQFGARSPLEPAIPIVARAGRATEGVDIRLVKGGAISGRVTDEFGEPLAGWSVTVGRPVVVGGRARLESAAPTTETDDLGEYRVGGLPAGRFVVSGFGIAPFGRFSESSGVAQRVGALQRRVTFYPDVQSLARATLISVRAGEEASGIDLTTAEPRLFAISGRIVDAEGRDASSMLSVTTDDEVAPQESMRMTRAVPPSGEFTMMVDAGEYTVTAQNGRGIAMQHMSVVADISGLQLILTKGARISGRVMVEGVAARPANISVEAAAPDDDGIRRSPLARVSASGTFTLDNVIGTRELRVRTLPNGWAVKSMTSSGRSIVDMPIDFKGREDFRDVVIVLTNQIAELSGTVLDPQRQPAPGASIIVFAENRRQLPRRTRWVRADVTGHFVIADLPAGEYLAVAANDVDDVGWRNAEYLEAFRAQAVRVTLTPGAKTIVALASSAER